MQNNKIVLIALISSTLLLATTNAVDYKKEAEKLIPKAKLLQKKYQLREEDNFFIKFRKSALGFLKEIKERLDKQLNSEMGILNFNSNYFFFKQDILGPIECFKKEKKINPKSIMQLDDTTLKKTFHFFMRIIFSEQVLYLTFQDKRAIELIGTIKKNTKIDAIPNVFEISGQDLLINNKSKKFKSFFNFYHFFSHSLWNFYRHTKKEQIKPDSNNYNKLKNIILLHASKLAEAIIADLQLEQQINTIFNNLLKID